MLRITDEQVNECLDLNALIDAMAKALQDYSSNAIIQVQRMIVPTPDGGFMGMMPAISDDIMGVKIVTFGPKNSAKRLPTYHATIQLFDTATGVPLALIDGGLITELRTAAVSAAAARLLAAADAQILTVLGTGAQARAHVRVFSHMRKFQEIRLWGRNPEKAKVIANELGIRQLDSLEKSISDADIILGCTSSNEPLIRGSWVKRGACVCSVGAFGPENREMDDELMSKIVVVDSKEAVLKESGDIVKSRAKIYAELGTLLAGTISVPKGETTVFKIGWNGSRGSCCGSTCLFATQG